MRFRITFCAFVCVALLAVVCAQSSSYVFDFEDVFDCNDVSNFLLVDKCAHNFTLPVVSSHNLTLVIPLNDPMAVFEIGPVNRDDVYQGPIVIQTVVERTSVSNEFARFASVVSISSRFQNPSVIANGAPAIKVEACLLPDEAHSYLTAQLPECPAERLDTPRLERFGPMGESSEAPPTDSMEEETGCRLCVARRNDSAPTGWSCAQERYVVPLQTCTRKGVTGTLVCSPDTGLGSFALLSRGKMCPAVSLVTGTSSNTDVSEPPTSIAAVVAVVVSLLALLCLALVVIVLGLMRRMRTQVPGGESGNESGSDSKALLKGAAGTAVTAQSASRASERGAVPASQATDGSDSTSFATAARTSDIQMRRVPGHALNGANGSNDSRESANANNVNYISGASAFSTSTVVEDDGMPFEVPEWARDFHIRFSDVELGQRLGSGAFGEVHKGTYKGMVVAVKTLSGQETLPLSMKERAQFEKEARVMRDLPPHRNVLQPIGVCLDPREGICLLSEFCSGGSLDKYVRRYKPSYRRVLVMAIDVCEGLAHLHSHFIVHRDLAARNLLMTGDHVIKVADFGLARNTVKDGYHTRTTQGPLKWMPPESVEDQRFSSKSDIWSYGVTIWELLSRETPYAGMTPTQAVIQVITHHLRLEKPKRCSDELYTLLRACWRTKPEKRPDLPAILDTLTQLLADESRKHHDDEGSEGTIHRPPSHHFQVEVKSNPSGEYAESGGGGDGGGGDGGGEGAYAEAAGVTRRDKRRSVLSDSSVSSDANSDGTSMTTSTWAGASFTPGPVVISAEALRQRDVGMTTAASNEGGGYATATATSKDGGGGGGGGHRSGKRSKSASRNVTPRGALTIGASGALPPSPAPMESTTPKKGRKKRRSVRRSRSGNALSGGAADASD